MPARRRQYKPDVRPAVSGRFRVRKVFTTDLDDRKATGGRIALKGFFPGVPPSSRDKKGPCPLRCFPPVVASRRGSVVAAFNEEETP